MSFGKIFYDGYDLNRYASISGVVGFTTNTTIIRQAGYSSYKRFYEDNAHLIAGRPISFQVFSDNSETVIAQAKQIDSIGNNIYVKVPIVNSVGESMIETINAILSMGIRVNITAVFTPSQISRLESELITSGTPTIISIFGGRISDTGIDPKLVIKDACQRFSSKQEIEILWCGCKDNLVIQNAKDVACHIVTLPDAVISRINRIGMSLESLSVDTVKAFLQDAIGNNLSVF